MTKTDKTGLSERQIKALPFFVSSCSDVEACREAKIARQTYYEWLKEPRFKEELNQLRNTLVDSAVGMLKAYTSHAVDVLIKLLDVDNPTIQRNVANDILEHVFKFREQQELERRLDALEDRIK